MAGWREPGRGGLVEDEWVLRVTDRDIRIAHGRWLAAWQSLEASREYVDRLYETLRRLIHAQAIQLAQDVRAGRKV